MRRRGTVSRKSSKTQHRKPTSPKRNNAPTAARRRSPSAADLQKQLDERTCERDEALEQQAATSEVLRVISSSAGELEPVFRTMLENATRVCEAKFGVLFRYEHGLFHPAALLDVPPAFVDFLSREGSFAPKPGQLFGRLCDTKNRNSHCR